MAWSNPENQKRYRRENKDALKVAAHLGVSIREARALLKLSHPQKWTRFTDAQRRAAVDAYLSGLPAKDVAIKYSVHVKTIRNWALEQGRSKWRQAVAAAKQEYLAVTNSQAVAS